MLAVSSARQENPIHEFKKKQNFENIQSLKLEGRRATCGNKRKKKTYVCAFSFILKVLQPSMITEGKLRKGEREKGTVVQLRNETRQTQTYCRFLSGAHYGRQRSILCSAFIFFSCLSACHFLFSSSPFSRCSNAVQPHLLTRISVNFYLLFRAPPLKVNTALVHA